MDQARRLDQETGSGKETGRLRVKDRGAWETCIKRQNATMFSQHGLMSKKSASNSDKEMILGVGHMTRTQAAAALGVSPQLLIHRCALIWKEAGYTWTKEFCLQYTMDVASETFSDDIALDDEEDLEGGGEEREKRKNASWRAKKGDGPAQGHGNSSKPVAFTIMKGGPRQHPFIISPKSPLRQEVPPGWEETLDAGVDVYYIDHTKKRTH